MWAAAAHGEEGKAEWKQIFQGSLGTREVYSGDVGSQVTMMWFLEVAMPLPNLSVWSFVSSP